MPLLLLAAVPAALYFTNRELERSKDLLVKGTVIMCVGYLVYVNRKALARLVKIK